MAACTTTNLDYVPPVNGCEVGARACLNDAAVECVPVDGGSHLNPIYCPSAATCYRGRCNPPAVALKCGRASDCGNQTACIPFVDENSQINTYCATPQGDVPEAEPCNGNSTCRSGICLNSGTAGKRCFLACQNNGDCPSSMPQCRQYSITLSGVQGKINGCGPAG